MKLSDFDYVLPKELIAQEGSPNREEARLFILHPDGNWEHAHVRNLSAILREGDLLVLNDTRVSKSKLVGRKDSGGKLDCLVLPSLAANRQANIKEVLLRGSPVKIGTRVLFQNSSANTLEARVIEKIKGARYRLEFNSPGSIEDFAHLPLPPYIKKPLKDEERYQTVFSRSEGSLAAPTAGLHFSASLMEKLKAMGVEMTLLTLHIGLATFAPVRTENVEDWKMQEEYYKISREATEKINQAMSASRRIFAVGTTTVRALETALRNPGEKLGPQEGWTQIMILPGYEFKLNYAGLLTNFHLPKSTLLFLASAFAGRQRILSAYREAIARKYRFFSLGDAMLILR